MYKREQVFEETLKYFGGDELATKVWIDKYCLKNEDQFLELTPADMHRRLAKEFARIENKYSNPMSEEEIFNLLKDFKFLVPQGSPMAGIGNPFSLTSTANCFVVGDHADSYGGIMLADEQQAQLMKRRGGVGQDISYIRPAGAIANGVPLGDNAGAHLYMNRFSNTTREVQQDGRRGALMLSISVSHPDAERFIDKKTTAGSVTGANVSVRISDDFMRSVIEKRPFMQTFPIEYSLEEITPDLVDELEYDKLYQGRIINGIQTYYQKIDPVRIWNKLVVNAWKHAEPGILFWDQILRESPAAPYGREWKEVSTNPCFVGDTLVAVADGRERVSFKQLADDQVDVPVYCSDLRGNTHIRMMRFPRKTGDRLKVFKVVLDSGDELIATENHKFMLKDGSEIELKNLKEGDKLKAISKDKKESETMIHSYIHKIKSINFHGYEDVYNGIVDEFHNYYVGGFESESSLTYCLTANCGEIPLGPFDSCRLLSINLYSYAYNPFEPSAALEDELLIDHTMKAMRLMDDIVDLEIEKIDRIIASVESKVHDKSFQRVELDLWKKIRDRAVRGRRTGLGILGEADLMAALGLKYGTEEGSEFAEKLHQLIATAAYRSSIQLAKERGAFPEYSFAICPGAFVSRMFGDNELMNDEMLDEYNEYGRRNIGLLTIAPTGSTSLMTQTTSGIEPLFSPYYFRKTKVEDGGDFDWEDEVGDKWREFVVFHKPFVKWYAVQAGVDTHLAEYQLARISKEDLKSVFEASPYFKATAQDVDYIEKVKMQGRVQKWVDHSISVTVNMPESVSLEVVDQVYRQAWESGCKGVTVYRENSRGNVLSTQSIKVASAESFDYITAYKRPKEVKCDVFFRTAKKQDFIIFVGIVDNKPYEVFALMDEGKTHISRRVDSGKITKVKRGVYRFESQCGKYVIENIIDHMVENEQNETRSVSAMLRHRMDPKYVVKTIQSFATITSFHKVIERVLSTYIKEEGDNKCPECGGKITYTEGCMKCVDCGYAKCG